MTIELNGMKAPSLKDRSVKVFLCLFKTGFQRFFDKCIFWKFMIFLKNISTRMIFLKTFKANIQMFETCKYSNIPNAKCLLKASRESGRNIIVLHALNVNPIQDEGRAKRLPLPCPRYQLFPCSFYKRKN